MPIDPAATRTRLETFAALMREGTAMADVRLAPDKWTLKEMTAHLVDSASNNHQRFIRLQLEAVLAFPKYDAEEWKNATRIDAFDYETLVTLWTTYNELILHLTVTANSSALGHVWRREDRDISLENLIHDYYAHLELHRALFTERMDEIKANQAQKCPRDLRTR